MSWFLELVGSGEAETLDPDSQPSKSIPAFPSTPSTKKYEYTPKPKPSSSH